LTFHSSKGDACDVENFLEYEDVVKKVLVKRPTRPITVYVDMKDVDRAAKVCISSIVTKNISLTLYYATERWIWRLGGRKR
jgi:hypothetical protein